MKKFSYRMQNILDIQYKLETQAKTAFGEANKKLLEEEAVLLRYQSQQEEYENQLRHLMQQTLDIPHIRECRRRIDVMKSRVRTQMIEVHMAQKNLEAARIRLQEAMITRKSHEVLKEKEFEQYKLDWNSEENKQIDELVSYTHVQQV